MLRPPTALPSGYGVGRWFIGHFLFMYLSSVPAQMNKQAGLLCVCKQGRVLGFYGLTS